MIRRKILAKFKLCKDIEYVFLLHLLEEAIPAVFYQYQTHYRSGNLNEYQKVIERIALLFICWKRRYYNKSTLSMLHDLEYYKRHFSWTLQQHPTMTSLVHWKEGLNFPLNPKRWHWESLQSWSYSKACKSFGCCKVFGRLQAELCATIQPWKWSKRLHCDCGKSCRISLKKIPTGGWKSWKGKAGVLSGLVAFFSVYTLFHDATNV